MPLVENTSVEELYRFLDDLQVDTVALRKKKPSYSELASLYLDLLNTKISQSRYARNYTQIFD